MSKRLKWVYPFTVMVWVSHSLCVLQLMMTYYVKTTEMCVSILSDGMGKPFSVRAGAGSLWNYYRYKVNESANENNA